jgi:hypothetical protein
MHCAFAPSSCACALAARNSPLKASMPKKRQNLVANPIHHDFLPRKVLLADTHFHYNHGLI